MVSVRISVLLIFHIHYLVNFLTAGNCTAQCQNQEIDFPMYNYFINFKYLEECSSRRNILAQDNNSGDWTGLGWGCNAYRGNRIGWLILSCIDILQQMKNRNVNRSLKTKCEGQGAFGSLQRNPCLLLWDCRKM